MESINLGDNTNWNRLFSFYELRKSRNDDTYPNRIRPIVRFTEERRLIITIGNVSDTKPWWITAGRLLVEASFEFDAVSGLGNSLIVHQQQLLLNKANLVWLPDYVFPYTAADNKYRLTIHANKWLPGVYGEIFEYDF